MFRECAQDMHHPIDPYAGPAVNGVGQHGYREVVLGNHARARDVALQAAGMAEPIPAIQGAADRAQPVIALQARMLVAPLSANHLAPTGYSKNAPASIG